jgi:phosphoketolase
LLAHIGSSDPQFRQESSPLMSDTIWRGPQGEPDTGEGAAFASWAAGYGAISHSAETQERVAKLFDALRSRGASFKRDWILQKLAAADRLANAAMWLVVHMTYAEKVDFSGRSLEVADFKAVPEGHTGGSLNMVPAYVGYLLANVLTGNTRSWVMGQGHCVAAIEAVNVLTRNLLPKQAERYGCSSEGLTRLVRDFYSYEIDAKGRPAAPLGSHVNAHTAGGVLEGGYLGFAETEYVHMPLKGESLVAFLSDGAFEEQRGADWAPRWWRAEDCGLVAPIMILNGRRIEERSEIEQEGGSAWLAAHLRMSGFDPIEIDGRDPAACAWAILEMEARLQEAAARIARGEAQYPVPLPYAIARTVKGYGFPGAGTNRAHNLPLEGNPHEDPNARAEFNQGAARLRVPLDQLNLAIDALGTHQTQNRPRERDHALATRDAPLPSLPEPDWLEPKGEISPMDAVDAYFVRILAANPGLRPRVGNPDELKSNHMGRTLAALKHRANRPEPGVDEAIGGAIITALNEEAVIGAALGNKGGISLAVSYEAFAVKMLGALRQEIIFARHQKETGRAPHWLGIPLIVSSHAWENGKNEQSHQDPTMGEALLGEMSDVARVLFPVDGNSAVEALRGIYSAHGMIGCLVVPKRSVPNRLTASQAQEGLLRGAVTLVDHAHAAIQFVSVGAYQLEQALRARARLEDKGIAAQVTAIIEPGRLRAPRDALEEQFVLTDQEVEVLFPSHLPRVLVSHTRPEPMTGILRRIDGGRSVLRAHGYCNQGGTLDVNGMLFANGCTWAHLVRSSAALLGQSCKVLLSESEIAAIEGRGEPHILFK